MDARTLSYLQSAGRIGLGAALALAPDKTLAGWVGDDAARPGAQVPAIGMGGRDVVIGVGQFAATRSGFGARPWVLASMVSDLADFAATMKHRDRLPGTAVIGVGTLALGSAMLAAYLASELD